MRWSQRKCKLMREGGGSRIMKTPMSKRGEVPTLGNEKLQREE